MNTPEEKIEQILKEKVSRVNAPRELFESTMQSVTKDKVIRNNTMRAEIPSLYQLINNFFMKKIALIGIPVAIIALVMMTTKGPNNQVANVEPGVTNQAESFDSIFASFVADAEAEAVAALSQSDDEVSVNSEIESFNSLKIYSYEDNI